MRRFLRGFAWLLLLLVGLGLAALGEAHWEMRGLTPVLPEWDALLALVDVADSPVRVSYVNTATQPGVAGSPLSHPAFVLEWADGRIFLIDTGMDREGARAFGRPFELLFGVEPVEPHASVAEQLGPAAERVRGVAFTHLHVDHTGGLASLCAQREERDAALPVFQIPWQADRGNYTTTPGREHIAESGCGRPERLGAAAGVPVPGFPGLAVVAAGGHTPGSSVYVARVAGATWVFAGDITFTREALLENRPKERIYSLLITPEAPRVLEALRLWLAGLDARPGVTVVVSHDLGALVTGGLSAWVPRISG